MPHAENCVVIDRPAEDVFGYLATPQRCREWRAGILKLVRMVTKQGKGAVYRQVLEGPGGRPIDADFLVTNFEPPHEIGFEIVTGPARATGAFELYGEDDRTLVRYRIDARPPGIRMVYRPMITRLIRTEVAQLPRLKAAVEAAVAVRVDSRPDTSDPVGVGLATAWLDAAMLDRRTTAHHVTEQRPRDHRRVDEPASQFGPVEVDPVTIKPLLAMVDEPTVDAAPMEVGDVEGSTG